MGSKIIAVDPLKVASDIMEQLPRGAFLTVKSKNHVNTMTIGWGTIGVMWSRPVFVAPVRASRYTFNLIEKAVDFTVSVPESGSCRDALAFCGTQSGKDTDKLKACKLATMPGSKSESPLVDIAGIHLECRTLFRAAMGPDLIHPDLLTFYSDQDYHTHYYGEIIACIKKT